MRSPCRPMDVGSPYSTTDGNLIFPPKSFSNYKSLRSVKEFTMPIDPSLNLLAERTLVACDSAYFTNITLTRPEGGDSDQTHLYNGDLLAPLFDHIDSSQYLPAFQYASIVSDYFVV